MGMPGVNISFTERAATAVSRGERGIVAIIMKDTVPAKNPVEIISVTDIPDTLTAANKKQIELALMGYVNAPKKVIAYILPENAENYADALNWLEVNKFDYLVAPTCATDEQESTITLWIKAQRAGGKKVKAVLPQHAADTEGIINYATASVTDEDENTYTAEQYCSRIAGIIAGTPMTIACTYAPLGELVNCSRMKKAEMDTAVDAGKLIVFHDGEKVKIARGVNSLTTVTSEKGNQFKKIKIVEAMDMINDDIIKTAEDSYLGKYANSYDNKCLLLSAISNYFESLIRDGILSSGSVSIDIDANRLYLAKKGVDVSDLSDDAIKTADTDDKVFMNATVKILDAIEEITLPIAI